MIIFNATRPTVSFQSVSIELTTVLVIRFPFGSVAVPEGDWMPPGLVTIGAVTLAMLMKYPLPSVAKPVLVPVVVPAQLSSVSLTLNE